METPFAFNILPDSDISTTSISPSRNRTRVHTRNFAPGRTSASNVFPGSF